MTARPGVTRLVQGSAEELVRLRRFPCVRSSFLLGILVLGCRANAVGARPPIHVDVTRAGRDAGAASTAADDETQERPRGIRLAGEVIDLETPRHANVATHCAARVAAEDRAQRSSGLWAHLQPSGATCREVTLPVAYRAAAPFGGVHAIRTESPLHDERTTLYVETPDGLAATGIEWDWENPTVGQSPQNPATLEELRVEQGRLVAIVGRRQGWMSPDGAPELALLRAVVTCERRDRALSCRRFYPDESEATAAPPLGMKRRPWSAETPWTDLAWDRSPPVRVDGDALVVDSPAP